MARFRYVPSCNFKMLIKLFKIQNIIFFFRPDFIPTNMKNHSKFQNSLSPITYDSKVFNFYVRRRHVRRSRTTPNYVMFSYDATYFTYASKLYFLYLNYSKMKNCRPHMLCHSKIWKIGQHSQNWKSKFKSKSKTTFWNKNQKSETVQNQNTKFWIWIGCCRVLPH